MSVRYECIHCDAEVESVDFIDKEWVRNISCGTLFLDPEEKQSEPDTTIIDEVKEYEEVDEYGEQQWVFQCPHCGTEDDVLLDLVRCVEVPEVEEDGEGRFMIIGGNFPCDYGSFNSLHEAMESRPFHTYICLIWDKQDEQIVHVKNATEEVQKYVRDVRGDLAQQSFSSWRLRSESAEETEAEIVLSTGGPGVIDPLAEA